MSGVGSSHVERTAVLGRGVQPAEPTECSRGLSLHWALRQIVSWVFGAESCPTLWDPAGCSPPGSSVHGILQAGILEWAAAPSPGDLPDPGMVPVSLVSRAPTSGFFTTSSTSSCVPAVTI